MDPRLRAAAELAALSTDLMRERCEESTVRVVVDRVVELVGACRWSSVTLTRRRGRFETVASSDEIADTCDRLQYELKEGPCVEAAREGDILASRDVRHDPRWPRWGTRVVDLGVGSVLSLRLSTPEERLGALNLYSSDTDAFDQDDVDLATIFATHAAVALNRAQLVSGLETAMHSRHMIGVAQGILMNRFGLSIDQSFEVLRRYSNARNEKLRDVAAFVVSHHDLPDKRDEMPVREDGTA